MAPAEPVLGTPVGPVAAAPTEPTLGASVGPVLGGFSWTCSSCSSRTCSEGSSKICSRSFSGTCSRGFSETYFRPVLGTPVEPALGAVCLYRENLLQRTHLQKSFDLSCLLLRLRLWIRVCDFLWVYLDWSWDSNLGVGGWEKTLTSLSPQVQGYISLDSTQSYNNSRILCFKSILASIEWSYYCASWYASQQLVIQPVF